MRDEWMVARRDKRVEAFLLDVLLMLALVAVPILNLWLSMGPTSGWATLLVGLATAYSLVEVAVGRSLGKIALRLRVARVESGTVGFWRRTTRWAIKYEFALILGVVTVASDLGWIRIDRETGVGRFIIDWLGMLFVPSTLSILLVISSLRRGVHDWLAGTVVEQREEVAQGFEVCGVKPTEMEDVRRAA